jgi:crossover junction endodeoxyribonuclease RusA
LHTQEVARIEAERQGWILFEGAMDNKLVLEMTAFYPDNRRRDMSNMHKLLPDSLEIILFDDDRWLLIRDINFYLDRGNPRVEVILYPLNESELYA